MWRRWQLFATDFQSLMYPNFVFCRILGAFPYKINASTFETSKQRYILSTLIICMVFIAEITIFHGMITKTFNIGGVTKTLDFIFYFMFGGLIAFITYVLNGPRMHILQTILKVSSRVPPESYQELSKGILGTFFLLIQGYIYFFRIRQLLIVSVLGTYLNLLIYQMDMQYMNCICVLKACFKRINDYLEHMQKIVVNNESYAPRLICHTQRNQFLLTKLKTLKKQHLTISGTVQMINIIFNLQILATITLTFTEVTFDLYFHLIQWEDGLSIILDDEIRDIFFIMSIGYDFLKIILIAWACETGKNQAFEIGTTVHDVLNRTSDEQIKEEVGKM